MKIWIGYPPLPDPKGVPLISQNRQFQWFNDPTFIYPVIPAYAATVLKRAGHDVFWQDGVAQRDTVEDYEKRFVDVVLRTVLTDIFNTRAEEQILRGQYDRESAIGRMVGVLNALDADKLPLPQPPAPATAAKPPELKIVQEPEAEDGPPE